MSVPLRALSPAEVSQHVFWTAPASENADLTPEDPLALDYLSQQVGYWLFGALTTRTSRAQYFAMVLYGLDLAGSNSGASLAPSDEERIKRFERWERFWALAVVESCAGELPRSSPNAFRGVRGAGRAWFAGDADLRLDYPLISRQAELGALGAYLSALRESGLVVRGTLRPSPAAQDILAAFWDEPGSGAKAKAFERYSMLALERTTVPRRCEGLTLRGLGDRTRLTALRDRVRRAQQRRLWEALFEHAKDESLEIAHLVRGGSRNRVTDPKPREFLERAIKREFGTPSASVKDKLSFALRFGHAARALLGRFNAIYEAVTDRGWVADVSVVVRESWATSDLKRVSDAVRPLLEHPLSARMNNLPLHGRSFLRLCSELQAASPDDALHRLLDFHNNVQSERQRGAGWMREEGGQLVLAVTSYSAYDRDVRFPTFKIDVVQSLLRDLGKVP